MNEYKIMEMLQNDPKVMNHFLSFYEIIKTKSEENEAFIIDIEMGMVDDINFEWYLELGEDDYGIINDSNSSFNKNIIPISYDEKGFRLFPYIRFIVKEVDIEFSRFGEDCDIAVYAIYDKNKELVFAMQQNDEHDMSLIVLSKSHHKMEKELKNICEIPSNIKNVVNFRD